ncbi:hypothetical protein CXG81DRAFT_10707 [Caulochytrium protostelioides]|uniref:Maf-like protein n=1 Tax=Caulochytrium protostelioides TaxID=1555241 RepID=A0A4P9XBM6_9FUNG|nr:hypothetical protein CXG81DRAFT_10707 [Caulochytrium protostelioides]|eukprot:RKP02511.1 hypothetical protein CXG81DRAFT_10707 [Caulochytrium protostelioides]
MTLPELKPEPALVALNVAQRLTAPLVLGSSSAFRGHVLAAYGIPYTSAKPEIDEKALGDRGPNADPNALTRLIAGAKMDALVAAIARGDLPAVPADAVVVTCDQVVTHAGAIREKPVDAAEARRFLASYSASAASATSGLVVRHLATGRTATGNTTATQHFAAVPDTVLDAMVPRVMWSAGGLVVEDPALAPYLREREGTEDEIIGMPIRLLAQLLEEVGACAPSPP